MAETSPIIQRVVEKFSQSREFTISFVLHVILVAIFGGTVLVKAIQEPPDFEGEGQAFVQSAPASAPEPPPSQLDQTTYVFKTAPAPTNSASEIVISTTAPTAPVFEMNPVVFAPVTPTQPNQKSATAAPPAPASGLTPGMLSQIGQFTSGWGKETGSGVGVKSREFEFTAYIGQYGGGNWDSTVRLRDGKIEAGGLPNLLYFISENSRKKIKTNYADVKAIRLDSDEIFAIKPPFILLTGTKDFKLTDKEVETLTKYVRLGGCIWGDSSVPGPRSRFDIAFRREMKRVLPDVDKEFEPLPANHPIYTQGYFPEIKEPPAGLNYYRDPVYALKIYNDKIAILYTANDYGDMWQIGLDKGGQIDLRKNAADSYVAINPTIWDNRDIYLRNISPQSLANCFKFGTNVVIYLLTRWESEVSNAPTL